MDGAKRSRNKDWIDQVKALKGKKKPKDVESEGDPDGSVLTRYELFFWEIFTEMNCQRWTDRKEFLIHSA